METAQAVTFPGAFLAGLASFITPCVLPMVPVYLCILSGTSWNEFTAKTGELTKEQLAAIHKRVLVNAVFFILGFSLIFIVAGLFAGALGGLVSRWGNILLRAIGFILVVFGMNTSGLWKPRFLNMEARFHVQKGNLGLLSSLLIGAAFAFGWTPCIGPILGLILGVAAVTGNKTQGALLLATYSLGLGVPFFLSALSVSGLLAFSNKWKRHFGTFELILGSFILFVGVFLLIGGSKGMDMVRGSLEDLVARMFS